MTTEVLNEEVFMFEEPGYDVYGMFNEDGTLVRIDAMWNIQNLDGWTLIEANVLGDKGHHAQSGYLPSLAEGKSLFDEQGKWNWHLVDGVLTLYTDEEKEELFPTPDPAPTLEERVTSTEESIVVIEDAICEETITTDERITTLEDAICELTIMLEAE